MKKYALVSSGKDFLIPSNNDPTSHMEVMILTHKLLRVLQPKQCIARIGMMAALCVEGFHIKFSQFFLNELMQDATSA